MSEEFSGQITRPAAVDRAGPDCGGQLVGASGVVVQHRTALGVELQPRPGHVALDDGHGLLRVGAGVVHGGATQQAEAERREQREDCRGCRPENPRAGPQPPDQVGDREPGQRGQERQARGPDDRDRRQQWAVRLREGDAAPREAAEREPGAQRSPPAPSRRRRTPASREAVGDRQRDQDAGRDHQHRLRQGQTEPRDGADIHAGPAEQRQEVGNPDQHGQPRGGPGPATVQGAPEEREPEDRRPPPGAGRGTEIQPEPAGAGTQDAQAPDAAQCAPPCRPTGARGGTAGSGNTPAIASRLRRGGGAQGGCHPASVNDRPARSRM